MVEEDEDAHRVEAEDIDTEEPITVATDENKIGAKSHSGEADCSWISGGGVPLLSAVDGVLGGQEVRISESSPAGDVGRLDPSLMLAYW